MNKCFAEDAMSRRTFLAGAAATMASAGFCVRGVAAEGPNPAPPNFIFILADDLGYSDLGCYGQKKIKTPHIDRMAAEGIRFTQCYAGAPVCAPSRCSLMTGLHGGHGRVRDNLPNEIYLRPDDVTIAEVLKQGGYTTGCIGKWGLGAPGSWGVANAQGFDYFYGHLDQDHAHEHYTTYMWEDDKVRIIHGNRGGKRTQYSSDLFTSKAVDFIRNNAEHPFFLYLAYTVPHFSDYDRNSPESQIVPSDAPYTGENWPQLEKNYAAMVTMFDRDVGAIRKLVEELGISGNTYIFVSSDNGPSAERKHDVEFFDSNGALRGAKRDVYEGGIRVPMIAYCPGRVPAGVVSDEVWAFWDVLPTFSDLAEIPLTNAVDGISFAPSILGGEQAKRHEYLYWDYGHVRDVYSQGVRLGNWKGVRHGVSDTLELYNLEDDPGETKNVAASNSDIVSKIESIMTLAHVPSPDYPIKSAGNRSPG